MTTVKTMRNPGLGDCTEFIYAMKLILYRAILRWRWGTVGFVSLILFSLKLINYGSNYQNQTIQDLIGKMLISNVALPVILILLIIFLANPNTPLAPAVTEKRETLSEQRVLIVGNNVLLGAGIENLLRRKTYLDVAGVSPKTGDELLKNINDFRPTVIILDQAIYGLHSAYLLAHLEKFHEMSLVIMSADNNLAQVYLKRNSFLTETADIINIITHKI